MLEKGNFPEIGGSRPSDIMFIDLDRIFSILRRQAWILILGALFGLALGIFYLALAPRTYVSASQVLIDKNLERVVDDVAPATSALDLETEILNQIEVVRSTRIATEVAQTANLMTDEEFLNPPPSFTSRVRGMVTGLLSPVLGSAETEAPRTEASLEEVVGTLRKNVIVERLGRSSVILLAYEAHSPELAQRIAHAYSQVFVQDQLNADLDATRQATDWLQGRLAELGESQREAALAVEQFRAESGLSTSEDQALTNQRLEALTQELVTAQGETARVRSLAAQTEQAVAAGPENAAANVALLLTPGGENTEITDIRARYASLVRRIEQITATYGEDHPQVAILDAERASLSNQIYVQLQGLNQQYQDELTIAERREQGIRANIENEGQQAARTNQAQVRLNELEQRATALNVLYNSFLTRYEESIQRQSFPIPAMRIITEALLPQESSNPRTLLVLAGSLIFGLFLGTGAGALNELRERSFRVGAQVNDELGLRFLGYLPLLGGLGRRRRDKSPAIAHRQIREQLIGRHADASTAAFLETLKSVKLTLRKRRGTSRSVTVGIVSALPGEGKTTFSVSFAEMLAASGNRVLLIDADLRQPSASRLLAPGAKLGLADIAKGTSWRQIVETDSETGLAFVPALSAADDATRGDFLASATMQTLLEEAREEFEYVIVDLPPLGPMVDAMSILPWTDGFILVTEWGRTPRRLVSGLVERDDHLADEILGVVLNKVDFSKLPRYGDPDGVERFVGSYGAYYPAITPPRPVEPVKS